jgi:uncharacterized hydrophobic protein (TIGR00341 family)
MGQKLIEVYLPQNKKKIAKDIFNNHDVGDFWYDQLSSKQGIFRLVVDSGKTEALLDLLQRNFSKTKGFRVFVLNLDACIPREKEDDIEISKSVKTKRKLAQMIRISRAELYTKIVHNTRLSWIYILMIIISTIVASIGLLRDSVTVIIGAMVIAPLLGPNVALSFATTLADYEMAKKSLITLLTGIFIALVVATLIGVLAPVNPQMNEIKSRAFVSYGDIILALAAGVAGVLSYTSGLSSTLVGVMVAVALLPPLANFGLLLGNGFFPQAGYAILLFFTNLICVNLAGVVTLVLSGIRPRSWWEARKAKRLTRIAIIFWTILFFSLIVLILIQK